MSTETTTLNTLTVSTVNDLTSQLTSDALANWTDDKRHEFIETFKRRVRAARYILIQTAMHVEEIALKRHYISQKHMHFEKYSWGYRNSTQSCFDNKAGYGTVGGRQPEDLNAIAEERASEIIKQLPGMAAAVRHLSPEAAGWIERRDKLVAKGKELVLAAEEIAGPLDLDELPGTTTLAQIKKLGEEREAKRLALKNQLDKVGKEGLELDQKIDKFLYNGLPGLSDAVVELVSAYLDKDTAFEAMQRRVEEQVMFGDSAAALEMLRGFENDEKNISAEVKAQFDKALDALKLIAAKGRKKNGTKLLKGNDK